MPSYNVTIELLIDAKTKEEAWRVSHDLACIAEFKPIINEPEFLWETNLEINAVND